MRFGFECVRCVVRSDALDGARLELLPEGCSVFRIPNGGVHFQSCTALLNIGFVKGEVLWQSFSGDDGLIPSRLLWHNRDAIQPIRLNPAGQVKHMKAVACSLGEFNGQLCCN